MSLLPVDNTGDAIIVYHSNARLECYKIGEANAVWSWDVNVKPTHLQTFDASECSLTQKFEGHLLFIITELPKLYSISSTGQPSEVLSPLNFAEVLSLSRVI